jgi:hypothetical protein
MTAATIHPHAVSHEDRTRLRTTYVVEGLLSFAANLLFIGIFFYTAKVFKWGLVRNFSLAAAQGAVYAIACLSAEPVSRALGKRRVLILTNVAMALLGVVGIFVKSPIILTVVIITYVPLIALNWPVLESAASINADAHTLSKRIGMYNLIWAGTGAAAVAVQGTIIHIDPRGVFLLPLVIHAIVIAIFLRVRSYGRENGSNPSAHAHLEPEPGLVQMRTLALWLSRIALPSTYVVIYSLSALMPLLPVMKRLDTTTQTVVASAWMVSRFLVFWTLGATTFWHARPRLLLLAAIVMLLSFVGVTVQPSTWLGEGRIALDLFTMILAQVFLGAALGLIYTASLYFGMVLSQGSTEHAGYHEALIGLGQIIGPGVGALTQYKWSGSVTAGVVAVSAIILASVCAAAYASIHAGSFAESDDPDPAPKSP